MAKKIDIGGELHSVATGNIVADAKEIKYRPTGKEEKTQAQVNDELIEAVGSGGGVDARIASAVNAAKAEIIGNATSACDTLGEAEALISAETSARQSAISNVIGDAASDYNTLGKLEDKIQAEATRAEAAEGALDGRVDTLEDAVGTGGSIDSRISDAVAIETTRAQGAESQLSSGKADKATTLAGYGITDAYTKSETYTKTEVNGLIDTPHQEYETVDAYANLPATGSKDTIYRVSNYNGSISQVDTTSYSEYAWDGTQYVFLCVKSQIGEVFDISVYNNNAKYADLAAALNGGANIPQLLQKGGMSVKFVCSSDNKYVQYRYMGTSIATADFTNVANWQGVDDVPTSGSDNLVKSRGVKDAIEPVTNFYDTSIDATPSLNLYNYSKMGVVEGAIRSYDGVLDTSFSNFCTGLIPVLPNHVYYVKSFANISDWYRSIRCLKNDKTSILKVKAASSGTEISNFYMPNVDGSGAIPLSAAQEGQFKTPADAAFVQFTLVNTGTTVLGDKYKVVLEDVGDTYNPDFVPSTNYVDGNPSYKIHNDVMNIDNSAIENSNNAARSGDLYNVKNNINDILITKRSKQLYDYVNVGTVSGVVDTSGGISLTGFTTGMIPVEENKVYCLSGRNESSIKSIRCLKADGTTIKKVLSASTGQEGNYYYLPNPTATGDVSNGQFKTPSDAAFVQITLTPLNTSSIGNYYKIMLEFVGDTYNPNFIPSPYESYFFKKVVSDESLEYPVQKVLDEGKKLSVLLIGSSHGVNTISMFPVLAYHAGIDITVGNLYTGSATIGVYPDNPTIQIPYMAKNNVNFQRFALFDKGVYTDLGSKSLLFALTNYKWDYVIVQRGATENELWDEGRSNYFQYYIDYIKEHCNGYTPTILFNSGIANATAHSIYNIPEQIGHTNAIMSSAKDMANEYGIDIIPTAVAVQYARGTYLGNLGAWPSKDMASDSQHLDTGVGQYVTACTVFEKVIKNKFGMSCRELDYLPVYADVSANVVNSGSEYFTDITEYYSRIGKTVAALAVRDMEYKQSTADELASKFGSLPTSYAVTNNLTSVINDNNLSTIDSTGCYLARLTPATGTSIQSVVVTMGGEDVTESVYIYDSTRNYHSLRIGVITGDIVIVASAS